MRTLQRAASRSRPGSRAGRYDSAHWQSNSPGARNEGRPLNGTSLGRVARLDTQLKKIKIGREAAWRQALGGGCRFRRRTSNIRMTVDVTSHALRRPLPFSARPAPSISRNSDWRKFAVAVPLSRPAKPKPGPPPPLNPPPPPDRYGRCCGTARSGRQHTVSRQHRYHDRCWHSPFATLQIG